MKAQKNKIVFVLVMVCVVLFITLYGIMTFGKDKEPELDPERIPVPDLEEKQVEFKSKLRALEALKEEHEVNAPPIYPEHMIDDKGYFNPDYMEYEKQRVIDSVFSSNPLQNKRRANLDSVMVPRSGMRKGTKVVEKIVEGRVEEDAPAIPMVLGLNHQQFFASNPKTAGATANFTTNGPLTVYVDGDQVVRDGQRLDLRLSQTVDLNGKRVAKDTRLYGFVRIRPNRVMVELTPSDMLPDGMKAYDAQDGREGIYLKNHLKGEVVDRSFEEVLDDFNVPGMPQLNGIKRIFQRNQRAIKIKITDHYQFLLKPGS